MIVLSRAALAATAVLSLSLLAGCSDDTKSSTDSQKAEVQACRSFEIRAGSTAVGLKARISAEVESTDGSDQAITPDLVTVRAAAIEAGLTPGISNDQFTSFKAVSDAAFALNADNGFDDSHAIAFGSAVAALMEACGADASS